MKIKQGLWYQCLRSFSFFSKDYWYYSPEDNHLKGNDNKSHRVYGFHQKNFRDGEMIKIAAPRK